MVRVSAELESASYLEVWVVHSMFMNVNHQMFSVRELPYARFS